MQTAYTIVITPNTYNDVHAWEQVFNDGADADAYQAFAPYMSPSETTFSV